MSNFDIYATDAVNAAKQYGVPPQLYLGVVEQESGWDPYALSSVGAYGLAQLMPNTAADLGVNSYDTSANLKGGAKYLSQLYDRFGNWTDAVGAYNAGPARWAKVLAGTATAPAETTDYIGKVFNYATGYGYSPGTDTGSGSTNRGSSSVAGNGNGANDGTSSDRGTELLDAFLSIIPGFGDGKAKGAVSPVASADASAPRGAFGQTTGSITPLTDLASKAGSLFSADFWQGAVVYITAFLAILLFLAYGIYRIINAN